ncbi:hypothetical protein [Streptomyces sp. BF23-18]|uniref:hypothetical protein n=1 Tax=unclassified Streptomyces TaxID=2593676 RepID=UPI0034E58477
MRGGATGDVTVRGLPAADRQWSGLVPRRGGSLRLADRLIRLDGGPGTSTRRELPAG